MRPHTRINFVFDTHTHNGPRHTDARPAPHADLRPCCVSPLSRMAQLGNILRGRPRRRRRSAPCWPSQQAPKPDPESVGKLLGGGARKSLISSPSSAITGRLRRRCGPSPKAPKPGEQVAPRSAVGDRTPEARAGSQQAVQTQLPELVSPAKRTPLASVMPIAERARHRRRAKHTATDTAKRSRRRRRRTCQCLSVSTQGRARSSMARCAHFAGRCVCAFAMCCRGVAWRRVASHGAALRHVVLYHASLVTKGTDVLSCGAAGRHP